MQHAHVHVVHCLVHCLVHHTRAFAAAQLASARLRAAASPIPNPNPNPNLLRIGETTFASVEGACRGLQP